MASTKSIAQRLIRLGLILPAALLIGLTSGGGLRADQMKPEDVESNRQSCMLACIQQSGQSEDRCKSYCDCSTKAMGEQVTLEEYNAGKVAIANGKQPAQVTVDKLTAIAKSCKAQLQ